MESLKVLKSEKRYSGRAFDLVIDQVEYASGKRSIREIADHPGGAVIVPFPDRKTILLIRQYRHPMRKVLYELPAGKLDHGEQPETCAARELSEETGYQASRLEKLTTIYTSPGFCNEQLHVFLATELAKTEKGPQLEEGEAGLTVEPTPVAEAVSMIEKNVIVDAKSICGIFLAIRRLGLTV